MACELMQIKIGFFSNACGWLKALPERLKAKIVEFLWKAKKLAEEDPRRITHSLKVGLALTLVSLLHYLKPLYDGFDDTTIWAVLTVVLVFEFSVGATIGKSLNRGLATFLAAILGFGVHQLAKLSGEEGESILLGAFVYVLAATVTFIRFFPKMKARYDYGLLILILTFCLISISGYREDEVLENAYKRVLTILIGGFITLCVCIFICPVWAGVDLQNLVATNIEKLGCFLERFGVEFFGISGKEELNRASLDGYRSVLDSKQKEESLANFARWELGHGQFKFRHPWKQYLKIGSLTRQCAYRIEALNGVLSSKNQTPQVSDEIKEACTKMSMESGQALKQLALAIRTMTSPSSAVTHVVESKNAANNLMCLLTTNLCKEINLLEVAQASTVASLLVDVVSCAEKIAESVYELASLAQFKSAEVKVEEETAELPDQGMNQQDTGINVPEHVITIDGPSPVKQENGNLPLPTTS